MALNGRLPASMLGKIPGTNALFPLAFIPQAVELRTAFHTDLGKPLKVTDGYRPYSGSYFAQVETMLRRYKPTAEFLRITKGKFSTAGRKSHVWNGVRRYLLPGQAQVAYPGTSNHGRPDTPALDLGSGVNIMDSREHRWVVRNAPKFGFRWPEEWARRGREPWHIEGIGVLAASVGITIPSFGIPTLGGALPAPLTPEVFMALSESQQLEMLRDVQQGRARIEQVYNASVESLRQIQELHVSDTRVRLGLMQYQLGEIKGLVGAGPADVDEEALARLLAPLVGQQAAALDDTTLRSIADAVNDESDRRDRARLAADTTEGA